MFLIFTPKIGEDFDPFWLSHIFSKVVGSTTKFCRLGFGLLRLAGGLCSTTLALGCTETLRTDAHRVAPVTRKEWKIWVHVWVVHKGSLARPIFFKTDFNWRCYEMLISPLGIRVLVHYRNAYFFGVFQEFPAPNWQTRSIENRAFQCFWSPMTCII